MKVLILNFHVSKYSIKDKCFKLFYDKIIENNFYCKLCFIDLGLKDNEMKIREYALKLTP